VSTTKNILRNYNEFNGGEYEIHKTKKAALYEKNSF